MKKYLVILVILCLGCSDLDIAPKNGLTQDIAFSTLDGYRSYIGKIYGALVLTGNVGPSGDADLTAFSGTEGTASYSRMIWKLQVHPSEQLIMPWNGPHDNDLQFHRWGSNSEIVDIAYSVILYLISLTNDFIRVSDDLPNSLTDGEKAEIQQYRNEARFLRVLAHYHLFDFFRNIPVITAVGQQPIQLSPEGNLRIYRK